MDILIEDLVIQFNKKRIIDHYSCNIPSGSKVAITGISGKGKSSLINYLTGFIKAEQGNLFVDGKHVYGKGFVHLRKRMAWLPQDISLQIDEVRELLMFPFTFSRNKVNYPSEQRILELLADFRLDADILDKKTSEISGGQKQRLLIISSLLQNKSLILLDEPSSALDEATKKVVADYLLGLTNTTVIAATHDPYWISNSSMLIDLDKAS